jgi:hypothetical protein
MRALMVLSVAGLLILASSCRSPGRVAAENERLRFEVLELQSQVTSLQRLNQELRTELRRAADLPEELPEDVRAAIPHVTGFSISRLSFARDTNRDGAPDEIILYLNPVDGRGRFVQMVGPLTAIAALVPAEADATTIGRITLTPADLRDAYRAGFTGTHYTIHLPIQITAEAAQDQSVFVRVSYTDARSGQTFTADRTISLQLH